MRFLSKPAIRSLLGCAIGLICCQCFGQTESKLGESLDAATQIANDRQRSQAFQNIRASQPGLGGAAQADFDSLIDLITTTVAPTSWDIVGGPGAVSAFPGGVYVNADGVLEQLDRKKLAVGAKQLAALRAKRAQTDVHAESDLRFVSLPALERNLQRLWAEGKQPPEDMRMLAGLNDVHYLFVASDLGDVVIAGPAGSWGFDDDLRVTHTQTGRPTLRLDDLVVLLRNAMQEGGQFSCSISPKQENLERTQEFLAESGRKPLKPRQRDGWVESLRESVGLQDVEFEGLNPQTRVARVLLEADYHMKLIGMDIEPSIPEIPSYLDLVNYPPETKTVLRWWFALQDDFAATNSARDTFQLTGQAVRLMSENEMLTKLGQRIHTGGSDMLNAQFTASFTKHFAKLAEQYPIYADLENVCKLSVVTALMRHERINQRAGWEMLHFLDDQQYVVPLGRTPKQVPSVVNYRVLGGKHIVAGVSGGVSVQPGKALKSARRLRTKPVAVNQLPAKPVGERKLETWWWD